MHTSFCHLPTDSARRIHTSAADIHPPPRLTHTTMHSQTVGLPYLEPHPFPLWCCLSLMTQIQQVILGQWAVNELILITVNSTKLGNICLVCWHACMQVPKLDRVHLRKSKVWDISLKQPLFTEHWGLCVWSTSHLVLFLHLLRNIYFLIWTFSHRLSPRMNGDDEMIAYVFVCECVCLSVSKMYK